MLDKKSSSARQSKKQTNVVLKKENIADEEQTLIDATIKPQNEPVEDNTARKIFSEAWSIARKYNLGFIEFSEKYDGTLNDASFCQNVILRRFEIISNDKRLHEEQMNKTNSSFSLDSKNNRKLKVKQNKKSVIFKIWYFVSKLFCSLFYSCLIGEFSMAIGIGLGFVVGNMKIMPYFAGIPFVIGFSYGMYHYIKKYRFSD